MMTEGMAGPQKHNVPIKYSALAVLLASTSGAAILAHVFGPVPMVLTAPFVVLPSTLLILGFVLWKRRRYHQFNILAGRLVAAGTAGFIATLAYDLVRPALVTGFGLHFDPFRAIPIFGQLMTGRTELDAVTRTAGWIYHFWNGISFGMMFGIVRPRGGWLVGWAWGLGLECLMLAAYPRLLGVRLSDPGFLMTGLIGHSVWGIVLGWGLSRMRVK